MRSGYQSTSYTAVETLTGEDFFFFNHWRLAVAVSRLFALHWVAASGHCFYIFTATQRENRFHLKCMCTSCVFMCTGCCQKKNSSCPCWLWGDPLLRWFRSEGQRNVCKNAFRSVWVWPIKWISFNASVFLVKKIINRKSIFVFSHGSLMREFGT